MGDHISMSISVDSLSDETVNWGPLALLLRRQYESPLAIDKVQYSVLPSDARLHGQFSSHLVQENGAGKF